MATNYLEGAFQPNFAKETSENDQSSDDSQTFKIKVKAVKFVVKILCFM